MKIRVANDRTVFPSSIKIANQYESDTRTIDFDLTRVEFHGNAYLVLKYRASSEYFTPLLIGESMSIPVKTFMSAKEGTYDALIAISSVEISEDYDFSQDNPMFISNVFQVIVEDNFLTGTSTAWQLTPAAQNYFDQLIALVEKVQSDLDSGAFVGNGIQSIIKISTSGLVDTYQITFTNRSTFEYQVTNGQNGQTPTITIQDGYWYINGVNTGQQAQGETGPTGPQGPQGAPGVNENVLHADISKSENPSVDDAYGSPLQDLKLYGKSTQESTTGKNLLPFPFPLLPTGEPKTINGLTATANSDGSVSVTGTKTIAEVVYFDLIIDKELATKGSITASPRGIDYYSFYDSANGHGGIAIKTSEAVNFKMYPMLEVGESVTTYEPYTGGAPSPSPDYPQEITCIEEVDCLITGKNIFDYQSIVDEATDAGFSTSARIEEKDGRNCLFIDSQSSAFRELRFLKGRFNKNTQYKFYMTGYYEGANTGPRFVIEYTDGSQEYRAFGNGNSFSNVELLSESDKTVDSIFFTFGHVPIGWIDLDASYIVELSQDTGDYEPYKSKHVQFTPPAPLYSLLDGSVADYVDVARGKYVYQLADVTFDGSEDESWGEYNNEGSGYEGVLIQRPDMKVAMRQSGFCDKLTIAKDTTTTTTSAWLGVNNNYIYFPYANTFAGTTNATEFRTWLATNNLQFVYPLATPTEQDIPTETLEALQALKTFNGVTNIFCNAPVSAQYEQSVQIVMNKILEQLNSLQTQTLSLQEGVLENV